MEVTQVKCLGTGTTVEYGTTNVNTPETHQLKDCPDARNRKFAAALAETEATAYGIIGLGARLADRYVLTGVAVSKDGNGHRGFVFTGKLRTNAGEVALNTPRMREAVDGEGGENTLTPTQLETVDGLLRCAAEYVAGEREQLELPVGGDAATAGATPN